MTGPRQAEVEALLTYIEIKALTNQLAEARAEIARLRSERDRFTLAVFGGKDAPGYDCIETLLAELAEARAALSRARGEV